MYDKPLALLGLLALAAPALSSGHSAAPDTPEPGSVEEIARATTETRFLSPWVAYLPASATVVSPRAYLHRIPGEVCTRREDRKSTRLNSSHSQISYAVFCLKKKKKVNVSTRSNQQHNDT